MNQRFLTSALVFATFACAPARPLVFPSRDSTAGPGPDIGSWADVKTLPGPHQGYTVVSCTYGVLGITGPGAPVLFASAAEYVQIQKHLEEALGAAVVGIGYGFGCDPKSPDPDFLVFVPDFFRVDEVAERLGAIIRDEHLSYRFSIRIVPCVELL